MHAALVRAVLHVRTLFEMRARVDLQIARYSLYCSIVECPSPLGQIFGGAGAPGAPVVPTPLD